MITISSGGARRAQMGMSSRRLCLATVLATISQVLVSPSLSWAQATGNAPPAYPSVDANGVDLSSGRLEVSGPTLSIGPKDGLTWASKFPFFADPTDSLSASMQEEVMPPFDDTIPNAPKIYTVSTLERSLAFKHIGALGAGAYTRLSGRPGVSLIYDTPSASFIFRDQDGTVATFSRALRVVGDLGTAARVTSIVRPTGERLDYNYSSTTKALVTIVSNAGYMVRYESHGAVSLLNMSIDACEPSTGVCATETSKQTVGKVVNGFADALGRTTTVADGGDSGGWTKVISRPGLASVTVSGTYIGANPRATSVVTAAGAWSYDFVENFDPTDPVVGALDLTRTDPLGGTFKLHTDRFTGAASLSTDELNRQTQYYRGPQGEITGIVFPEGDKQEYPYASVGVISGVTRTAKPGSSLVQTQSTATFPSACSDAGVNEKTCRKPIATTDPRGAVTDYTYDLNSGQVLTETRPAGPNGVRPQTRYTYTPLYAQYKNASGVLTAFVTPIYKLTQTSTCMIGASPNCVGTADETRTTYAYNSNNLWPTLVTVAAGDGSLSATTTTSYDAVGNVVSVDGPLPGTADTTVYKYDALRRKVGEIGPAFVNAQGQTRHRASRTTYHLNGQVQMVETGVTTGQDAAAWAGFQSQQRIVNEHDSLGRLIKTSRQDAAGTAFAVSQFSYDAVGRQICSTVRMNPAAFGALPAACARGADGPNGPDRITYTEYDATGRVTKVTGGYGGTP